MSLFTPEGERSWAGKDGWDPEYPDPSRTVGVGTVFTTGHGVRTTIWVMVDHTADRVRYARINPSRLAGTVEVRALSAASGGTDLRVTYDLTALEEDGARDLASFAAGYEEEIATWADDIAESLARSVRTQPPDDAEEITR